MNSSRISNLSKLDHAARAVPFHSPLSRKETLHTLSLLAPHLRENDRILDVGCGSGYEIAVLSGASWSVAGVDVVNGLRVQIPEFRQLHGIDLPFGDSEFDVVMLNFVLHHMSHENKLRMIAEVRRVTSRILFVFEDTPRNFLDRWMNRRHGEQYRRKFGLTDSYGFYSRSEWQQLFDDQGFEVSASHAVPRLARSWQQPYARSAFVLNKVSDQG
jgi:SAM-dependent methyltransferase